MRLRHPTTNDTRDIKRDNDFFFAEFDDAIDEGFLPVSKSGAAIARYLAEGYAAAKAGKPESAIPYMMGGDDYEAWTAGWAKGNGEEDDTMVDTTTLSEAFPDFPVDSLPAIPAGFVDQSWHNDTCPSFHNEDMLLTIYIDYPLAKDREFTDSKRFTLVMHGETVETHGVLDTDNWAEVEAFIAERRTVMLPQHWEMRHRCIILDGDSKIAAWATETFYILDGRTDMICGGTTPSAAVAELKRIFPSRACDTLSMILYK